MKRSKIYKGKNKQYLTYADDQSLEETHDMIVKALPGQSYLLEQQHKVNTSEVTGESLKKVSVGGKGGMGSQGDARDQAKQIETKSRVMVLNDAVVRDGLNCQQIFDHNVALDRVAVKFRENVSEGIEKQAHIIRPEDEYDLTYKGLKNSVEYIDQGETYKYKVYNPSHLFGSKEIKGWIEFTKTIGRDFDDFSHSAQWDASDNQRAMEVLYAEWDTNCEFAISLGLEPAGDNPISLEMLETTRARYDEICGYRGAWKYLGIGDAEHRRYCISIVNTLNLELKPTETRTEEEIALVEDKRVRAEPYWTDEHSVSRHHKDLYLAANKLWRDGDEEAFDKWMADSNNDHAYFVMWKLDKLTPKEWSPTNLVYNPPPKPEPSEEYLRLKDESERLERQRRLQSNEKAHEVNGEVLKDLKMVYNWELSISGKLKSYEKL